MIDQYHQDRVREVDRGLFLEEFTDYSGLWIKIKHKDDRNGLVRDVFKVRNLDIQALQRLRHSVDWQAMMENPDPFKLAAYYEDEERKEKARRELERMGFVTEMQDRYERGFEQYRQSRTSSERKVIKRTAERELFLNPKAIKIYT